MGSLASKERRRSQPVDQLFSDAQAREKTISIMDDNQQKVVSQMKGRLVKAIDSRRAMVYFRSNDLLDRTTCDYIQRSSSEAESNIAMIDHLTRIDNGWKLLIDCLVDMKQRGLADALVSKLRKVSFVPQNVQSIRYH